MADCFAGFDCSRCASALKSSDEDDEDDEDDEEKISVLHRCVYNAHGQCVV